MKPRRWEMLYLSHLPAADACSGYRYSPAGLEPDRREGTCGGVIVQLLAEGWEPMSNQSEQQQHTLVFKRPYAEPTTLLLRAGRADKPAPLYSIEGDSAAEVLAKLIMQMREVDPGVDGIEAEFSGGASVVLRVRPRQAEEGDAE